MKKDNWEKWIPEEQVPKRLFLESFSDNKNGIQLIFRGFEDEKKMLVFRFQDFVFSYRNTDEGNLLKTINYLDEEYGQDFYTNWSLFKVKESSYIRWLNEESYSIYQNCEIEHFVFMTNTDIVEILTNNPPEISTIIN